MNNSLKSSVFLLLAAGLFSCNIIVETGPEGGNVQPPPPSPVTISAIEGIISPVQGEFPVVQLDNNEQFSAEVIWDIGSWTQSFGGGKAYTATINLDPKDGYTLVDVTAEFFTVAGADSVSHEAGSSVVTAIGICRISVNMRLCPRIC